MCVCVCVCIYIYIYELKEGMPLSLGIGKPNSVGIGLGLEVAFMIYLNYRFLMKCIRIYNKIFDESCHGHAIQNKIVENIGVPFSP